MTWRNENGATYTQTFDVENRLTQVTNLTVSQAITFTYDGDGNLVKKEDISGTTTIYVGGHYEVKGTGEVTKYYYAAGQRVALRKLDNGGGDELYYLHTDHLGSTSLVTYGQPPLVLMSIFARYWATGFRPKGATRKSDARELQVRKKVTKGVSTV
jgi:YD repeat-containing protein